MKKYSAQYFEDKFDVLYKKLLQKEDFEDEVKNARKTLGLPEGGFQSEIEFADYLMGRMNKKEKELTTSLCFVEQYEMKHGMVSREDMDKVVEEFDKKFKNDFIPMVIMISFQIHLTEHNNFFTQDKLLTYGKKNNNLYKTTKKIFDKYMGVDLLDPHIVMHYIEKYIFLGDKGVREYIKRKVSCSNCRYIGVNHFSPIRKNMKGQDAGPFSGKYLFNESTVRMLSNHFDSVFLIIKPYATKDEVVQYVNDNWNDIKEHIIEKNTFYKQYGINPSKIKKSDVERNRLVYELYKLPKKELLEKYKGEKDLTIGSIYKEMIISAILKDEYDIEMTSDAVKKTATRFAKSTKLKREPKDIRDI